MTRLNALLQLSACMALMACQPVAQPVGPHADFHFDGPALVIHGGAGGILPGNFSPAREAMVRESLNRVLNTGTTLLKHGATAMDVVVAVLNMLENDSLFNAGSETGYIFSGRLKK